MINQKGQILLITIMLVATVLTVVLAVTFKSTTETQLTKLEEESQKALAAAEAGVEIALQQNIGDPAIDIDSLVSGYTGQATVDALNLPIFSTPLLQKDQQYTFYLTNYDSSGLGSNYWSGTLDVNFKSETDCPTIEITFIRNNNSVVRNVLDPCTHLSGGGTTATVGGDTFGGVTFEHKASFAVGAENKVLIVRTLFAPTRVGFKSSANLPLQGKYVTSEAKSEAGVSKKVQLFQSYPQIPAEFFVTSF